jgi:hypothetical protein
MLACERSLPPNQIGRATNEIADHDPIAVAFPDRDLINADCLWTWRAGTLELDFYVLLIERLHGMPVQFQFRRHLLDRHSPATAADVISKPLGVERLSARKSSCSIFTLPQPPQSSRRISNSR